MSCESLFTVCSVWVVHRLEALWEGSGGPPHIIPIRRLVETGHTLIQKQLSRNPSTHLIHHSKILFSTKLTVVAILAKKWWYIVIGKINQIFPTFQYKPILYHMSNHYLIPLTPKSRLELWVIVNLSQKIELLYLVACWFFILTSFWHKCKHSYVWKLLRAAIDSDTAGQWDDGSVLFSRDSWWSLFSKGKKVLSQPTPPPKCSGSSNTWVRSAPLNKRVTATEITQVKPI